MRELPILFSGPMIKAIMEGKKTMTRRVIKLIPHPTGHEWGVPFIIDTGHYIFTAGFGLALRQQVIKPAYQVGDRLWVKETWVHIASPCKYIKYKADDPVPSGDWGNWKSGRFMPKKYARLWLEVTAVRAERLQEISEEDIAREGCPQIELATGLRRQWFRDLWDALNGKTHPWESNPWVWIYSFRRSA